jgi:phosphoglucosamine mutase
VGRLFGTDGVRGVANRDLTAEVAVDLSVAAAHVLGETGAFTGHRAGERPLAVVGRDPRASGEFLEAAVIAGFASAGVDVQRLGVLPTPAVAYLTAALHADLGVMISASHNAMPDNGIKFLSRGGHKLDDATEDAVEARLREPWERPIGAGVGRVHPPGDAGKRYVEHVLATLEHRLDGLSVVLDCANGAAHAVAPAAFEAAGARVVAIHNTPDGYNINDGCGSTHLVIYRRLSYVSAPTSASHSTVTPTAASGSTPTARSSTETRSSRCLPGACATRDADRRHRSWPP